MMEIGQMPKDLDGDASCSVPGPTNKTLDVDSDPISQVFDDKLVNQIMSNSIVHKDLGK